MVSTHVGSRAGIGNARSRGDPGLRRVAHDGGGKVEAAHLVAGLDEVARHRQPHVAETDEADARHAMLPLR